MSLRVLQGAALFGAALFISASVSPAWAQLRSKKAETYKDIIEKAYNLSLQKDRSQAVSLLVNTLKQEKQHEASTQELRKALQQVSYVFYSNQAQQTYELGVSLRKTDPGQAQQKIAETLRAEPDNLTVFNEMQRLLLIKNDCSAANDNITKQRVQNPIDEELLLLQGQAQACLGQWEELKKTLDLADLKKSPLLKFWLPLQIELEVQEKDLAKAKEDISALQKQDPKDPQLFYWQWRVAEDESKNTFAEKYIKDCKNISPSLYRQYMTDVNLCRKISEVEAVSKNSNGSTE